MKGFIYKITNKVNNKIYIGQTRYTVEFRWRQHKNKKTDFGNHFHDAIRKYGEDNFLVETLEECDVEKLNEREIYYIAKFDSFNNGYNTTLGGEGKKIIFTDSQYDEITGLYLAGFSSNKIATLYKVDKATIVKLLKSLGIKIRSNKISINKQEFEELVNDYNTGYSLRELAKRYDCTPNGLKEYLQKKGVNLRTKYSILEDKEAMLSLIDDYTINNLTLDELQIKYHCSYQTVHKILSIYGVSVKKKQFKLNAEETLKVIDMLQVQHLKVQDIARHFKVNKCTIYSLLRRYHINYLTV